ncbi:MAG TPA: IS30 family transposase [Candidatus Scatomorpha merdipullorum]|uniref:IS30 family transposase n=1 Tax=Candidatus Scatomorpha merdipullorum TaxID=2840927 RepID=A0A9D1FCC8_9FIRM|nr:IS30 family transposase [Candidatus Scatomorpha merdipullorum]
MIGGYFSPADRQQIAEMWAAYQPVSVIACALMVDPSTVHRELKLGNENGELDENKRLAYNPELAQLRFQEMYDTPTYYPHTAQKKYLLRRSYCHRGMFWNREVIDYIDEKLRATWSPEQIAGTPCGLKLPSWRKIEEKLHCDVYFADPYCAWQKGTVENLNGLLREFYPKGRNLSRVSPATLKRNLALINARPRKVLNFHSPQDLWDFELSSCCS